MSKLYNKKAKTERKRKNPDGILFSKKKKCQINNNHYFYDLYNGHLTETKARGNLERKENLRNYIIGIVYSHNDISWKVMAKKKC